MKIILIYVVIVATFTGTAQAQTEPKAIDTKDLIEKLDRSELESGDAEGTIDGIMPEFEIPKIEFESNLTTDKTVVADKPQSPDKTKAAKEKKSTKGKVVVSNKTLKPVQLNKNDKIVVNKGKIYVYRLLKSKIIQYKFNGKLPLDSSGLKANGDNSYYVINKAQLVADTKSYNLDSKKTTTSKQKSASRKAAAVKKSKAKKADTYQVTAEEAEKRKSIETKYNGGRLIKRNLNLKDLQINDDIYIFGEIQLVTRRNKNIAGLRKYWLIEKLDVNNNSIKEVAKNKYRVNKSYQ